MNVSCPESETGQPSAVPAEKKGSMRLSMHDGVAVWCDCCSCEAEPYWLAVSEDPGIDGSGSADGHTESVQEN